MLKRVKFVGKGAKLILIIIFSVYYNFCFAQGEANVWYFGNGAGLDFNFTPPAVLENGNALMDGGATMEGAGSISDADGNLVFYTNGKTVFNRNHVTMLNGTGLLGGSGSSAQTGLCLPVNGSTTQYFIFSTDDGALRSYFSIVDMTLDGGLGGVSTKNSALVASNCSEAVVAIPEYDISNDPTGESWIIFHDHNSNNFRVYKTSGTAVNKVADYAVGFTPSGQSAQLMKTNGCFNKIGVSYYNFGRVDLCPFNNVTGVVSEPSMILEGTGGAPFLNPEIFGIEFSPNDQFLYIAESGLNSRKTIYQFKIDVATGITNPPEVLASKKYFTADGTISRMGHLQLGPDGKIYVPGFAFSSPTYINVIPNPNVAWTATTPTVAAPAEFEYLKYIYSAKLVGEGLPIFSQNLLRKIKIFYNNACEGGTTSFSYLFGGSAVSQTWDFGDPTSGGANTSTALAPSHSYSVAGTYKVKLSIVDNCGRTREDSVNVIIKSGPTYTLPVTTCANTNITVTGTGTNATNYTWSLNADMSSPSGPSSSFTSFFATLPATVYVRDPTPLATHLVGNTAAADNSGGTNNFTYFELFTTVKITAFKVRSTSNSGTTDLSIQSENGLTTYWSSTGYASASGTITTFNPDYTLPPGVYRFFSSNNNKLSLNSSSYDGGRDVMGVINVQGQRTGSRGGPFYDIALEIPDPCGVRAITIPLNCCTPASITTQPANITRCEGVAASFTVVSAAATPTYQWQVSIDGGANWNNIPSATAATLIIPGVNVVPLINNTQYRVVIDDAGCVNISNAATLTVNPLPTITSASTGSICSGLAQNYDIVPSITSTISWSRASVANISNTAVLGQTSDPITETLTNTGSSPVNVVYQITPTSSPAGCPAAAAFSYTVTVNPTPALPTVSNVTYCKNATATALTATGTGTLNWYTASSGGPALGSAPTPSTATAGNPAVSYWVSQTISGCEGPRAQIDVIINNSPTINNNPLTEEICEGTLWSGLTLSTDFGPATFAWTSVATAGVSGNTASGSSNLPSQTFSNSTSSNGTVTYTIIPTANSCPGASANYVVTVKPRPVVTNTPLTTTVCEGTLWSGVTLSADVSSPTFTWTSSATAGITGNTLSGSSNIGSSTFANSNLTSGTVTYTISPTANGCSGTNADYVVTVNPLPTINSASTGTICSGVAQNYDIIADISPASFSWNRAVVSGISNGATTGQTADPITETLTNTTGAAVDVLYVITPTANGCAGSAFNYTVTVDLSPSVNSVSTGSICSGVAQNYNITSNVLGATFIWNRAAVSGISNGAAIGQTADPITETLTNTTSSPVNVTYVITPVYASSCAAIPMNYVVTVNPGYQFTDIIVASDDTICEGSTATFTVNNISAGSYINWTVPAGAIITNTSPSGSSVTVQFGATGGGLTVTPVQACTPSIPSLSSSITVMPKPIANAGSDIQLGAYGTTTLDGSQSTSGSGYTSIWTTTDASNSITAATNLVTSANINAIESSFALTIQAKGTGTECSATAIVNVKIIANLFVPNVFSPNGDGDHDYFNIEGIEYYPKAIVKIYNQWGELVFKGAEGYPEKWDGKRNGTALPVSSYYYVLYLNGDESVEDRTGYVSILK